MIFSRYNNPEYILNIPWDDSRKILNIAYEEIFDARLWERWLVELSGMDKETFISFEDYKIKVLEYSRLKNRTQQEKKIEVEEIRNKAREAIKRLDPLNNFGKEGIKNNGII